MLLLLGGAAAAVATVVIAVAVSNDPGGGGGGGGGQDIKECLPNDSTCWTSRFGGDTQAADDFLDGVIYGPGGFKERSAGPDGFVVSTVGYSLDMVEATEDLSFHERRGQWGTCAVYVDPEKLMLAVNRPGVSGD